MIPFTTRCWICAGGKVEGNLLDINTKLANYLYINNGNCSLETSSFIYKWYKKEEEMEQDKDPSTRLLSFLQRYYGDLNLISFSPIMLGMMCSQMGKIPLDLLYEMQESSPHHWEMHHALLLEHMMIDTPVDIIGFYRWLATYVGHNATAPHLIEKYWYPYMMGSDLSIKEVLQKQGLFVPTLRGTKEVYRWTDRYLVSRINSMSDSLVNLYRMRNMTRGIRSVNFHSYRLLPGKHLNRIRISD